MRLGLRGTSRRVWGRRGVKVYQPIQLRYEWRYLFLVVEPVAGTLDWCWIESLHADQILAAVGALQQTRELKALVWDGAGGHRAEDVRALPLTQIRLPAYSPELNPAERLFQEIRRVVEGKVYATIEDKMAAVEAELAQCDAEPDRVRSVAGWRWITEAIERLPADKAA